MSNIKGFLYVTLGVLGLLLVQFWFQQTNTAPSSNSQTSHHVEQSELTAVNKQSLLNIESDSLIVSIDPIGGKIVKTELKGFFRTIKQQQLVELFGFSKTFQYFALSGFQGDENLKFEVTKKDKKLLEISAKKDNIIYVKRFDFSGTPYTLKQTM